MRFVATWKLPLLLALAGLVVGLTGALAQEPRSADKYALLVGVTTYRPSELRNLKFSENDVTALAETLKAGGYRPENIQLMTRAEGARNPRLLPLAKNIRTELQQLVRARSEGDSVIVAFAGHGVQFKNRDESYFCPTDAKLEDLETLVPLSAVYQELEQCKAGFKLLLVDACRNDPFAANTRDAGRKFESLSRPPKKQLPGGVAALFSCSAGEKAFEDEQLGHGVFFHFVVAGLKSEAVNESSGEVTLPLLEAHVQQRVKAHVANRFGAEQTPERQGTTRGLVALLKYPNATAAKQLQRGLQLAGLQARGKTGVLAGVWPRGDLPGALAAFNQAIQQNPNSVEARANRAVVLWNQCRFPEALDDANRAVQADPRSPAAFCARSLVYMGQGQIDPAIADADAALRLDRNCTLAYCNRAFLRWLKWDLKGALADCEQAIRIDPAFAVAYCHRSLVYLRLGKLDQALADCDHALQLDPKLPGAYSNRAVICWAQGVERNDRTRYEKGLADCNEAINLDPKFTPGYTVRALNRLMKGEVLPAMEDLKQAQQHNPADQSTSLIMGYCYLAAWQYQQAATEFNRVIGVNKFDAQAHEGLGAAYAGQGKYAEAVASYKQAASLMPAETPMGKAVREKLRKLQATRPGGFR